MYVKLLINDLGPWIFIGRTDAEAPILWPPDAKNQLTGKDPGAGKDWRQEEKGATQDEMVGWYDRLNAHESEQAERQWRTGKPGVLQSRGLQRVRHNLATEQQIWDIIIIIFIIAGRLHKG